VAYWSMVSYRIIPKRNAYNVESTEDGDVWVAVRSWRSEEQAVSHLNALRAAAAKAQPQPPPERRPGRPMSPYRTTRYH